jgi:hypothetical protein
MTLVRSLFEIQRRLAQIDCYALIFCLKYIVAKLSFVGTAIRTQYHITTRLRKTLLNSMSMIIMQRNGQLCGREFLISAEFKIPNRFRYVHGHALPQNQSGAEHEPRRLHPIADRVFSLTELIDPISMGFGFVKLCPLWTTRDGLDIASLTDLSRAWSVVARQFAEFSSGRLGDLLIF